MENFIPYEKLSKKQKKALDRQKRGSWHGVRPVTKRVESRKIYNRKKALKWKNELPFQGFCIGTMNHGPASDGSVFNTMRPASTALQPGKRVTSFGIGRRPKLKISFMQLRTGSIPVTGTAVLSLHSAKGPARLACSLASALTTASCRCQPFVASLQSMFSRLLSSRYR